MTTKTSTTTTPPPTTAKAKVVVRPLDETYHIVHNCRDDAEKGLLAVDVFNDRIVEVDAKMALEMDLVSYEGRYDEVPYDPKDPLKGSVEQLNNAAFLTNIIPAPDSLSVNTQPKRMGKMELKAFKKSPFLKNPKNVTPLLVAAERRSMRRVLLGHHYLIGALVTYPGYDATYDEVCSEEAMMKAVLENTKVNHIETKSSATRDTVTIKNFANFAVVYIWRADGSVEARFAEPTLVTITVANYIAALNARVAAVESEAKDPEKLKQYRSLITRYIELVDAWLKSSPKNSPDTVLTMYNYNIVSDNIVVETEVFHFLRGTAKKPLEAEKIASNWLYIHNHANRTHVHAEFRGKVRSFTDKNGDPADEPDDVQLKDDENKMFSVSLRYAIPIVPDAAYTYWKKSAEGQKAIEEGGKKKRAPKKSTSLTKPKKSTDEDDDENDDDEEADDETKSSKKKNASKRKSKATDDDDGDDDDASEDDDGDEDEASEESGKKKGKKKNGNGKSSNNSAAKGKPSKAEIGEHGTADETAKKIKADLAAAKKAKAKEAEHSRSADNSDAEDDDEQAKKKAKKATSDTDAKAAMENVANHTASFKGDKKKSKKDEETASTASTVSTPKKLRKKKRDDDEGDEDNVEKSADAKQTTKKAKTTTKKEETVKPSVDDDDDDDDKPLPIHTTMKTTNVPERFFLRRRLIAELAETQQLINEAAEGAADNGVWDEFEKKVSETGDLNLPWGKEVEDQQADMIAFAKYSGLSTLFIDAQAAIKARQEVEDQKEALAAKLEKEEDEKRKADEEAEKKRVAEAAAAEEKRRKQEEAAEKRRKEKEAEKKRLEEEAAAKAAEEAAAAAAKAAEEQKKKADAPPTQTAEATSGGKLVQLPGESKMAFMKRQLLANKK